MSLSIYLWILGVALGVSVALPQSLQSPRGHLALVAPSSERPSLQSHLLGGFAFGWSWRVCYRQALVCNTALTTSITEDQAGLHRINISIKRLESTSTETTA